MTSFYKKKNTDGGFTLIELLVVIAIIGILSSVVLASLNSARERSRDARRQTDLNQIRLSLALMFDDCGTYPQTSGSVDDTLEVASANCGGTAAPLSDYMSQVPQDPSTGSYQYVTLEGGNSYCVQAQMEGDNAPDNDADCGSGGTEPTDLSSSGGDGAVYSITP